MRFFPKQEISSVRLRIDNGTYVQMESTNNKNLYVLKWNPQLYKTGLHRLTVKAKVSFEYFLNLG